jgi:hypothetical protein
LEHTNKDVRDTARKQCWINIKKHHLHFCRELATVAAMENEIKNKMETT